MKNALVLVSCLLAFGCEKAASTKKTNDPVKLLAAGGGEKRELRLNGKAGAKDTVVMTTKMHMKMTPMGIDIEMPPYDTTMEMVVKNVTADGDIEHEFTITAVDVKDEGNPMVVGALKQTLPQIIGLKGTGTFTNRGVVKAVDLTLPAGLDPMVAQTLGGMKDAMKQMSAPFPLEAVGVGAKWQIENKLETNGMKIDQIVEYTVTGIEGDKVMLDTKVVQSAPQQTVKQQGVDVTIKKVGGGGTGKLVVDLTRPVPTRVDMDVDTSIDMAAQGMDMHMDMDLQMTMVTKQ